MGTTGSIETMQGYTGQYRAIPYHMGQFMGYTGQYGAIQGHTGPYWTILDHTGLYRAIHSHTGPYGPYSTKFAMCPNVHKFSIHRVAHTTKKEDSNSALLMCMNRNVVLIV